MTSYPRASVKPAAPPGTRQADNSWIVSWPRSSFLELGAYETAPGSARGHIRNVLPEWALGPHVESAELVATELLTNSINAARAAGWVPQPAVRLWLLGAPAQVMVLVWDPLGTAPQPRTVGRDGATGMRLRIRGHYGRGNGCAFPFCIHSPGSQWP
jgi:hypothetical protein